MDYLPMTIRRQKNIALIAHDQKKRELIQWCGEHKDILSRHFLCGTGTTARMITDATNLHLSEAFGMILLAEGEVAVFQHAFVLYQIQ